MIPLLLLLGSPSLAADGEVWTSVEIKHAVSELWSVEAAQNLRLSATPFGTAEVLTDLGVAFEAHEYLELAATYRVGFVDLGDDPESRHRFAFDAKVPLRVGPVKLSLRERYQVRVGTDHNSERHILRTRLAATLKREGVEPYIATEPFVELESGTAMLQKWRSTVGVDIPVDDHEVSVFYRVDVALQDEASTVHIGGLSLQW